MIQINEYATPIEICKLLGIEVSELIYRGEHEFGIFFKEDQGLDKETIDAIFDLYATKCEISFFNQRTQKIEIYDWYEYQKSFGEDRRQGDSWR